MSFAMSRDERQQRLMALINQHQAWQETVLKPVSRRTCMPTSPIRALRCPKQGTTRSHRLPVQLQRSTSTTAAIARLAIPLQRKRMDPALRGPGYYSSVAWRATARNESGGAGPFNKAEKGTFSSRAMKKGMSEPGPGDYNIDLAISRARSFTHSTFSRQVGSELDRQTRLAAKIPGPGDYNPSFPVRSKSLNMRQQMQQLMGPHRPGTGYSTRGTLD